MKKVKLNWSNQIELYKITENEMKGKTIKEYK